MTQFCAMQEDQKKIFCLLDVDVYVDWRKKSTDQVKEKQEEKERSFMRVKYSMRKRKKKKRKKGDITSKINL